MAPRFSLPLKRALEVHESCGAHASGLRAESTGTLLFFLNLRAAFLLRSSLDCRAPLWDVVLDPIDQTLLQPC